MGFKKRTSSSRADLDPAAHFKSLTKRQFPDVMPHQKDILEEYAANYVGDKDVGLRLPTGSGKTLVGLLIADWRRIKYGERVVYLCPNVQLVKQTVSQAHSKYGIDVVDLSGSKKYFKPVDATQYKMHERVAITTHSGLFNTNPYFQDPDLIIVDDAHAAENYISKLWSVDIEAGTTLYSTLLEFFQPHLSPQEYARLKGDWEASSDDSRVSKIPSPLIATLAADLGAIIDAHEHSHEGAPIRFTWSLIRDHLSGCHVYIGGRGILIRPLIPPTSTHAPFSNATQRIFMSATLGSGGDLERLTGRKKIRRLSVKDDFQSAGVGRRFFIFPSLSFGHDETQLLRSNMQGIAGRSVVITPTTRLADKHIENVTLGLPGYTVFDKTAIEENKAAFAATPRAVAVLANRYDGIDFPGDECRLLCVDGLPKATNYQEQFIMSKMGALALYNDRIQTRVLQAIGRCTRSLEDRSAVFITGGELVDFLTHSRKLAYLPAEQQAELSFGIEQSKEVDANELLDRLHKFLVNDDEWVEANRDIRDDTITLEQKEFPAMDALSSVVKDEIVYQEKMWNRDYVGALAAARAVLGGIHDGELRGYRALWHYLAGSAAVYIGQSSGSHSTAAAEHFSEAKKAAPVVSWLNELAHAVGGIDVGESSRQSDETLRQVESLERTFDALGTVTHHKFESLVKEIEYGLKHPDMFESAQTKLGDLLGFRAGNDETNGAPDPWWLGESVGLVFETHAEALSTTDLNVNKARQAASHKNWIEANVKGTQGLSLFTVLLTPCVTVKSGAEVHLGDVRIWALEDFRDWAARGLAVLRELKGTYPGDADLAWRANAAIDLESHDLTLESINARLKLARDVLKAVH